MYASASSGHATLVSEVTSTSWLDAPCPAGGVRYYQVAAVNAAGASPRSIEVRAEWPAPSAPLASIAKAGPDVGGITVTWAPPATDNGCAITAYRVYAGSAPGRTSLVATIPASAALSFHDGGLAKGVYRYYHVSAVNVVGETLAAEVRGRAPIEPTPPTAVVAAPSDEGTPIDPHRAVPCVWCRHVGDVLVAPSLGKVRIAWSPPVDDGGLPVQRFDVYRSTPDGADRVRLDAGNVLAVTDEGLVPGMRYHYVVTATNAVGEGETSDDASSRSSLLPGDRDGDFLHDDAQAAACARAATREAFDAAAGAGRGLFESASCRTGRLTSEAADVADPDGDFLPDSLADPLCDVEDPGDPIDGSCTDGAFGLPPFGTREWPGALQAETAKLAGWLA